MMWACAFLAASIGLARLISVADAATDGVSPPSVRVLPPGKLPDDSRLGPLRDLNGYFPFSPPKSRDEWTDRADRFRRQVSVATGLWPMPEKTPLHAEIYGKVDREGYTVEKVYFESYPGHFVTGNLYRPKDVSGKVPGVLCPYGHFTNGRFNVVPLESPNEKVVTARTQIRDGAEKIEANAQYPLQAYPVQLARMGCIAFQYDMEGYCDSVQIPMDVAHSFNRTRPEMDLPHDWGFFSTQADLRLQSIMGLQTYNSIRALDFLCELPEVDQDRLAVTGASSGGTQTLMVCAVDPRPSVAVPVVMVSTAKQGGCVCENCELLRLGVGNVDFAALFAPKPLEAIGADDWTKDIETKGGPELQQLYGVLGAKENLAIAKFPFPHNFNSVSRTEMYQWMNKQLKLGLKEPVVEEEFVPLSHDELAVWDAKHPAPAGGEEYERSLLKYMTDDATRQLNKLVPTDEKSLANFRKIVGGAWQVIIDRGVSKPADVEFQQVGETAKHDKFLQKKGLLRYKPDKEEIPIVILLPAGETRRTAIWLDPAGKAGLFGHDGTPIPSVRKLLDAGVQVVGLDLFEQGEFLADNKPLSRARMIANEKLKSAAFTFGYNRSLFAQRVHDVLSAVSYFHGDDQPWGVVDLVGLNSAGRWAVAAKAIAGDAVNRTVANTEGFRFVNLVADDDPDFLPGSVKYFDLPGLMALCSPAELWVNDGMIHDSPPELVTAAFKAAGSPDNFVWYDGPGDSADSAAIEWLLRK